MVFYCDKCDEVFTTLEELKQHAEFRHAHYVCEPCGKAFTRKDHLKRHQVNCTPGTAGADLHHCLVCDTGFSRQDSLKRHQATCMPGPAGAAAQFRCLACDKGFKRQDNLQRHSKNCKGKPGPSTHPKRPRDAAKARPDPEASHPQQPGREQPMQKPPAKRPRLDVVPEDPVQPLEDVLPEAVDEHSAQLREVGIYVL